MALGKIDHIDLSVTDLEEAERYFTEELGFKLLRRTEHAGKSTELQSPVGDFFFDLHQGDEGLIRTTVNHIAFSVDDINKECEDLKGKGVLLKSDAPVFIPMTGRTIIDVIDFDGRSWIQLTDPTRRHDCNLGEHPALEGGNND